MGIEDPVCPYVIDQGLKAAYKQMAQDEAQEAEALEWSEAMKGEVSVCQTGHSEPRAETTGKGASTSALLAFFCLHATPDCSILGAGKKVSPLFEWCFFTTGFLNGLFSTIKNQHVREMKRIATGDLYCEWDLIYSSSAMI
jgi:hypothetical protein